MAFQQVAGLPVGANSVSGEDIDSILDENDAIGDWEDTDANGDPVTTPRWLFERFPGADQIGTCSNGGEVPEGHDSTHARITKGKDKCGADWEPDPGNMYLSRTGLGYDTDVETIAAWLAAPRNMVGAVLLLGEPGTGKTALVEAAVTHADRTLTTIVCTPDHTKDSLFLRFVGEGHGDPGKDGAPTPFVLGPLPYAAKHGHTLYADEFMLLIDGIKPLFYSLADGRRFLPEGNVDGSPLEIHPDFRLILSSNPLVRGASLPEPLASRCASTTITVETGADMLRDLGIAEDVVAAWEALKQQGLFQVQVRELRLADYWLPINKAQAVSAFLPEHCPEADRPHVRDIVVSYLGGSLNAAGRLVVR